MDIALFMTITGASIAIIGSNIALISWLRSDMKMFESKIETWKDQINQENRDFHGRLCSIEEKNRR